MNKKYYDVTVKMFDSPHDVTRYFGREKAEEWAEVAYECDNVYAVEIMNAHTGEIVWYKSKD